MKFFQVHYNNDNKIKKKKRCKSTGSLYRECYINVTKFITKKKQVLFNVNSKGGKREEERKRRIYIRKKKRRAIS